MKTIRKSVYRARLENELAKYQRRIQKMAENAYKIRQMIEQMQQEEQRALSSTGTENQSGDTADANTGGSDIQDSATPEVVLGEQPATVLDDSRDLGINSGSAV